VNWIERKYLQFGWSRLEKRMPNVKRWAPLIGSGVLVAAVVLRTFGLTDIATLLESLTGVVGLDEASPVSGAELAAAAAAMAGIVLKLVSVYKATKAEAYLAARPEAAKVAAVQEVLSPPPLDLPAPAVAPAPADVEAVKDVLRAKE